MPARGSGPGTNRIDPVVRAEKIYLQTRIRYEHERTNPHLMWQLGQACFELADIVDSSSRREKLANEGIDVCKAALERDPKLAAAQYYYALNLGQLARTKSIGALKLVSQMEAALKQTIKMDPLIDFAGPHRSLGLLYRDAPGWPASIGSRSKARQQLEKAVDLSNDFPENWLCLLESYLNWGERRALETNIKKVDALLAKSRTKYSDSNWAVQWQDWERRWHELLKQFPPAK
jgi:hypothetical protein